MAILHATKAQMKLVYLAIKKPTNFLEINEKMSFFPLNKSFAFSLLQLVTLGSSRVGHVLQKHVTKRSLSLWNEDYFTFL